MANEINSIDELLQAIHNSVIEAQKIAEQQHIRQLFRYFEFPKKKNESGEEKPQWHEPGKPRTIIIKIPNPRHDPGAKTGQEEYIDFHVPQISLVPPSSIQIKELSVRFKVRLSGFLGAAKKTRDPATGEEIEISGPVHVELGGFFSRKSQLADVSITFEATTPPESILRINDQFIKAFP